MKRTIYRIELSVITMVRGGKGRLGGKGREDGYLNVDHVHHIHAKSPDIPLTPLYQRPEQRLWDLYIECIWTSSATRNCFVAFCAVEWVVGCCHPGHLISPEVV